jgi:predicted nuclease of predicted toxin-antitoxin system
MSLRFFADHCVSNSVVATLRDAGHEVLLLNEHIACDSDDPVVLAKAQELEAVLVSLDGDFADIVVYPPSAYLGIIALQVKNHPEVIPALLRRVLNYVADHPAMGPITKANCFLWKRIGLEFGNSISNWLSCSASWRMHRSKKQNNLQPIRLHSNLESENHSGFDADSRRRGARLFFRFNRRPLFQAGRRGFDPRLPLLKSIVYGLLFSIEFPLLPLRKLPHLLPGCF